MVAMVKRLSQRVVVPLSRVRFPLATPPTSDPRKGSDFVIILFGMRKIITTTFVTLDGVMQAPGGPEEDTSGGFAYGGWQRAFPMDETLGSILGGFFGIPFELLLGRFTYDIFAGYWPTAKTDL